MSPSSESTVEVLPAEPFTPPTSNSEDVFRPPGVLLTLFLCALLIAAVVIGLLHVSLPAPPSKPSEQAFAVSRALPLLQQIALAPRPVGSAEHARVRQYLLDQLKQLGLQVELQEGIGHSDWSIGQVSNIVARLPGRAEHAGGKAILLSAHYDSVATSPGAADNAASIAAILESLRALRTAPALRNDIIILFSDAEEVGSLGAQLFANQHAWRNQLGLVLNFEYRGNRGPHWMFESSAGNGKLIAGLAQAVPQPYANSLLYEVYKHMPNYTDFTQFKRLGIAGLNFAAGEGHTNYHTQLDTVERLDAASLQHAGDSMLGLLRYFGEQDLQQLHADDVVYFDLPGLGLISYAPSWLWPLLALALFACALLNHRRHILWWRVLLAPCLLLLSIVLLAFGSHLLWQLVLWLHPTYRLQMQGSLYNQTWYLVAMLALSVALFAALQKLWQRWVRSRELALGAALIWLLLLFACQTFLRGASFVFLWPLLPVLLLLLILPWRRWSGTQQAWAWAIALLPAVILMTPLLRLIFLALTPAMFAITIFLFALLLCLFTPLFALFQVPLSNSEIDEASGARRNMSLPLWLSLPIGIMLLIGGSLNAGYNSEQPRPNHLAYLYDGIEEQAYWYSRDLELDHWGRGFFSANAKRDQLPQIARSNEMLWISPAPSKLPLPKIQIISDRIVQQRRGKIRSIELNIASLRLAPQMQIKLEGGRLFAVQLNGHRITDHLESPWQMQTYGLQSEGVAMLIEMEVGSKLHIKVVDRSQHLPATGWPPRPLDIMIQTSRDSDTSQAYNELQL